MRYKEKFTAKVINAGEKWIVGRKDGDVLPGGYNGFAGVDCSGFITKLWHYGGEYEHLGIGDGPQLSIKRIMENGVWSKIWVD